MNLEHIEITNFKGIQYEDFSFTPEVNLIIGDNGTGKTSILEAISVALGGLEEIMKTGNRSYLKHFFVKGI